MSRIHILVLGFLLFSGCASAIGRGSELPADYYSDMEYSNVDKRWYHKNQPDAHDAGSYDSGGSIID